MDNRLVVQDFLETYTVPTQGFNGDDDKAANIFAGAITYAINVFSNHMILGGMHQYNREDKMEILDNLRNIAAIIEKYQKEG